MITEGESPAMHRYELVLGAHYPPNVYYCSYSMMIPVTYREGYEDTEVASLTHEGIGTRVFSGEHPLAKHA